MAHGAKATLLVGAPLLALALAAVLRLPTAWQSGNALNHVSGTWMALADDLTRGVLYRPIHASGAYGGTRYFPLAFSLQAALVRMGASHLAAAYAASLTAALLLALGVVLLLRRTGAGARAAAFAPLALAGFAGQHALSDGRGDLLPVALSALALGAIARGPGRGRVPAAAALLTLAFAAKPTALTAAAAATAFLAVRGQRRAALALAALVAAGTALVVVATDLLSGGRFLASLGALATAGANLGTALRSPFRLAEELILADPAGLILALAAAAAIAVRGRALAREADHPALLPALWLAAAWGGALVVFATPGTAVNHLVELEVASATVLGASAARRARARAVARAGSAVAALAGVALAVALFRADLASSRLAEIRAVVRALPPGAVLSEDPVVPILAGARPAVLDVFSLRLVAERDPAIFESLSQALRRREFASIVLFEDPASPAGEAWYAHGNLGLPLAHAIAVSYCHAMSIGRYRIYVPRPPEVPPAVLSRACHPR